MKRILTFIMVLACAIGSAQTANDVLLFSLEDQQGTARFQGMSGAFGALGGDMSALNINPASSAVFNNSIFSITGTHFEKDNATTYGGGFRTMDDNRVELNQLGGVFVYKTTSDSEWKKLAFAVNYDMVQQFNNEISVSGSSAEGIDNYFLAFAQGVPFGSILIQGDELIEDAYLDIGASSGFGSQQAFLGYYGGLIDPTDMDEATSTYVPTAQYNSVNHEYRQSTSGYNSKFTLNFAGQHEDDLYVGASLNFHTIFYDKATFLDETGYESASPVQSTIFDNLLHTEGSGFSFQLGAIAKVNESIRLGGSYQSPTWYRLTDDTSQRIDSELADDEIGFIDFNIINLFEEYEIKVPAKYTGSVALVFGRDGLLSFDYTYQDMANAELQPTSDPSFSIVNDQIANNFGDINSFRIGAEYRIDEVSLRGGYRMEESPYADGNTVGDLTGYSLGLGYSFGGSRLDLAFNQSERDINMPLYDVGISTQAFRNLENTQVALTYTLNF
ncbi:MAG: aromatic hydrocarbon degradation protein [Eudoraea sp.]|nr:aromatic hydrocarbon degradation protein [Eudoraea sp.]